MAKPFRKLSEVQLCDIEYATNRRLTRMRFVTAFSQKPYYLGKLLTLTLDYSFEKAKVKVETRERVAMVVNAKFLSSTQRD